MVPCAGDEEDKNGVLEIEIPFSSFFLSKSRNWVSEKLPAFCFVILKWNIDSVFFFLHQPKWYVYF